MVVGAAVAVGVFVGAIAVCIFAFGVQVYVIATGKIPQDKQYFYPYHHTFVPFVM